MSSVLRRFGLFTFVITILFGGQVHSKEIKVAVASNFLSPVRSIAKAYEQETGGRVLISAGSTGKLYAQIINGAPFDVFLAANHREPERLEQQGYALSGSRFTYAEGKLVLWDPQLKQQGENYSQVLKEAKYKRLSLANPLTAPYGAAGFTVLKKLELANRKEVKLLRGENVSQAFQFAATGAADLGFVALSQVKALQKNVQGQYWLVDDTLHEPILQQAVLLTASNQKDQARAFLDFLNSEKSKQIITEFGYGLNGEI